MENIAKDSNTKNTKKDIPDLDVLFELADLFKVFGDSQG